MMLLEGIVPRLAGHSAKIQFMDDKGEVQTTSFGELYRDIQALSGQLRQSGLKPGMRVGILAPTSYQWMVWDLSILTCGAISVAFPHEAVKGSLSPYIERLEIDLLAASRESVESEAFNESAVVDIDLTSVSTLAAIQRRSQNPTDPRTHSLVFSSGTTGKTKGLIISRLGTEHLLNLYEAAFGVQSGERFLTFLPFANYQQRMAYYFCLYHGIDFCYVPFQRLFPGLKVFQPTYVIAPPVFFEATHGMAEAGVPATSDASARRPQVAQRLRDLLGGNIRYLITGMAPIKRRTLDFFWDHGVCLYEAFGITEAGMVCWNKPGQVRIGTVGCPAEAGSVSLGPDGEVIVTREHLLSLGYFESSEEDARATFLGPHSVATGDIAQLDEAGYLSIVGRKKDAIVTRTGEKFHPEAIEVEIQCVAGVKSVVVLGGDPLPGVGALVVVADQSNSSTTAAIRARIDAVNASLPQIQRVRQVVFTETDFSIENGLRTRNLKLNRRAIFDRFMHEFLPGGGAHGSR